MINDVWGPYIKATSGKPPSNLLVRAIDFVPDLNNVLEIGPGALNDVLFLINYGFSSITAVDKNNADNENSKKLPQDRVDYIINDIVNVDLKSNYYSLVTSQYTLPFTGLNDFEKVFDKIKKCIKPGGIFVGQLFGCNDDWSSNTKLIFHKLSTVKDLLFDMEVIELSEEEYDGKTALQGSKHWHIFNIIARKNIDY